MRVSEILNESEQLDELTRPDSIVGAGDILRKAGYKRLGEGEFAEIYAKPGEKYVLKLFKSTDAAYMEFVDIVKANQNVHFPKFKGSMMKITTNYWAIRMERLRRATGFYAANSYVLGVYIDRIKKFGLDILPGPDMENLEKTQPGITKACKIIGSNISSTRMIDIHNGNIMMRGKTLVIIDPVAY